VTIANGNSLVVPDRLGTSSRSAAWLGMIAHRGAGRQARAARPDMRETTGEGQVSGWGAVCPRQAWIAGSARGCPSTSLPAVVSDTCSNRIGERAAACLVALLGAVRERARTGTGPGAGVLGAVPLRRGPVGAPGSGDLRAFMVGCREPGCLSVWRATAERRSAHQTAFLIQCSTGCGLTSYGTSRLFSASASVEPIAFAVAVNGVP
jgi:hypothetical protein